MIVESKLDTIESMDGLLQAACVAETASRAETRSDNSRFAEMSAEIAALRQQSGFSGRGRGRGRGCGSGGGGSSSASQSAPGGGSSSSADGGPSARQKIALRRGWTNCYKCEQWGKHKANECNLSRAQINRLVPMDPNVKPTGPAIDTQFDRFLDSIDAPKN